jgi:PPIC-type PPIASE domain
MKTSSIASFPKLIFCGCVWLWLVGLPGCFGERQMEKYANNPNGKEVDCVSMVGRYSECSTANLTGTPLVFHDGVPIITIDSLNREKEKLMESNPQFKMARAFMNETQIEASLADALSTRYLMACWAKDEKITQQPQYKQELLEGYATIEHLINTKYFSNSLSVQVGDAEVRKFYEENKDVISNIAISRGGVRASGVMFAEEAAAQAFAKEVRAAGHDMQAAAKKAAPANDIKDFKLVTEQTLTVDGAIRKALFALKSFPQTVVVEVGKDFWVVTAQSKEESQYRPYEQVKHELTMYLEKEQRGQKMQEEMEKLKQRYKITVDETYFASELNDQQEGIDMSDDFKEGVDEEN